MDQIRKALQFLVSVSIFSFFCSYSSWLPFLHHSFNLYFSTLPFHLFNNYTIDRNCMFLLCNGILVFLTRNSGLIGSSPSEIDHHEQSSKRNEDSLPSQPEFSKMNYVVEEEEIVVEIVGSLENLVVEDEEEKMGNGFFITEGGKEEEGNELFITEEEGNELFITEEEEEEEEEEGHGLLSTEELNKKFDDFIKKMKEGIRFEAQQQLIIV